MTTTVRMYQARGLLDRPVKRGRVAFYGPSHLQRLRLIADLQRRGHSLAGIKELVDNADRGTALPELLGLQGWSHTQPVRLTPAEFLQRFGGAAFDAAVMQRAAGLGLVRLDGEQLVVDERFLQVGSALIGLGLPVAAVLDEWEALLHHTREIADRFAQAFSAHLWPALDADAAPLGEITAVLDRLAPLAQQVTALALEQSLNDAAAQFVADHGPR